MKIGDRYDQYLPILCSKPSIKDVTVPKLQIRSASATTSGDPLSPKVGCMGQVHRHNRVSGYPVSHNLTLTTTKHNNNVQYLKLKKIFSGENLINTTITTAVVVRPTRTVETGRKSISCIRHRSIGDRCRSPKVGNCGENCSPINIVDMDPPLPVIKKVQKNNGEGEADSLWKRRSGGIVLKTLKVQQCHLFVQPTTV